jgi:flagellar assembly protein FliH
MAADQRDALSKAREDARAEGFELGRIQGYKEGFSIGSRDGRADGVAQIKAEEEAMMSAKRDSILEFVDGMEAFTARADEAIKRWTEAAEERLAGLAIEIASRALNSELTQSRESITAIVRDALREAEHATKVRVRVNPKDVATLESHQQEIIEAVSHIQTLEIAADPSIEGGCCVESESGLVDARIESYLARLADHVRRAA